ncbi:Spo11/DNA topoisomerase VI subunit A [Crepidotus variabilis]|uniref:DNA topoisomerase (ATP-hydrolyzing) n=1 Tax=Crepidotus variabilis TaxID=179855 RepID=A0A9P6JJ48_9AGAR|nr:Spo11/DNA topoisomerase VI subunit A [Crepidotus variabilis]
MDDFMHDIFGEDDTRDQTFFHSESPDSNNNLDFQHEEILIDSDEFESESFHEEDEYTSSESEEDSSSRRVLECVEDMTLSFLRQLSTFSSRLNDTRPEIGTAQRIDIRLADRKKEENADGLMPTKVLRYPRKCQTGSARPFAQLFRFLDLVQEATLSGIPTTKRDIYYKDVPLFKSQRVVDTLVDDLAATFELERSDLNIRSSSKGLVCGSTLTARLVSGEVFHCRDMEASLIPTGEDIESFSIDLDLSWILVVEKEAVFQTLCQLQLCRHENMPGPGLIITGKGYPDVATRHLLKSLGDALPKTVPILGLVDGDPYGLDILSVYKYGSRSMQHENGKLATRRIKWLGLWASEISNRVEYFLCSLGVDRDRLIPITKHDEKKAKMEVRPQKKSTPVFHLLTPFRKELQHMLHSRRKAEIEILSSTSLVNSRTAPQDWAASSCSEELTLGSPLASTSHNLLLHYLCSKVTEFVQSASGRDSLREMIL